MDVSGGTKQRKIRGDQSEKIEQPARRDRGCQPAGAHVRAGGGEGLAHGGVAAKACLQAGLDAFPHPGLVLLVAARREPAALRLQLAEALDAGPELGQAHALQRTELHHLRVPQLRVVVGRHRVAVLTQQAQRRGDLRARPGGGRLVEVGLVDHHQVGQLHHALLDGLQVVAGIGQLQQHEHVGHSGHRDLALADADGLDDHHVVARRLGHQHRLARLLGHAAQRARGRAGADVGALVDRQPLHAGLVAEDGAARDAGRRVDRQHRDAVAALHQEQPQALDEGRLADPRHARDAQPQRAAAVRQQRVDQFVGAQPVVLARGFEQRDGLGDGTALHRPVRAEHAVDQRLVGDGSHRLSGRRWPS